ncbi:hypothetical protein MCOR02_008765 [Pyricularia oryzae]|nr:hypothetical protein MCOR02_008765 [Pyricularia oryzae]KAI6482864.1 hypothetical protein MCOR13_010378 [Pyricularia oryzae]
MANHTELNRVQKAKRRVEEVLGIQADNFICADQRSERGLSINTAEALAMAALKMRNSPNLVSSFKDLLYENCRARGESKFVNSVDIHKTLQCLGLDGQKERKRHKRYLDLIKSSHYVADPSLYAQKIGELEASIAGITELVKSLEDMVVRSPELTSSQHRAAIEGYNSALETKVRELKACQSEMDRVNRDLRNAEVAFNQAEQLANEAADADRKAILEQNATAILLVSWTVCARGIEAVGALSNDHPEKFQKLSEASLAVALLLKPVTPLGSEENVMV